MNAPPSLLRVLIVDDNRDAADILSHILVFSGYATQVVYSGWQALLTVREFVPDIVLLDISMPELDGFQVAEQIRTMAGIPQPLLIAFTAWCDDATKLRARNAGFDLHIAKPVDTDALQEALALRYPSNGTAG